MIHEILTYLFTPATKTARSFGHLYESIALIKREKRCAHFWQGHRENCKNNILKFASKLPDSQNKKVLILGSGPLHEIPIVELASLFYKIDLVDVVHLRKTKKQYRHLKNISFIEADITEVEEEILKTKKPFNKIPSRFINEGYDLVISANVLSQLSYHLKKFLEKKCHYPVSLLEQFCYQLGQDHYQYLLNFKVPVLLITDIETHFIGLHDELLDKEYPYIHLPLPKPQEVWWWDIAPRPEFSPDYSVKMLVAFFILNFKVSQT